MGQVIVEKEAGVATIWLNREQVRNAFNEEMIADLLETLVKLDQDPGLRLLILRGKGPVFCAGADLNWMRKAVDYSYNQNMDESLMLAKMLNSLYTFSKPTIALVHGAAIGGGVGLISCCDFVFSLPDTKFSFSEVKLGLVPAVISPYAVKRIGERYAKQLMLTGKLFGEDEALDVGLIDFFGEEAEVQAQVSSVISLIKEAGPEAVSKCKRLISKVVNQWTLEEAIEKTSGLIAEIRSSNEAQEGMRAFLAKKKPNWKG
ncbi:MAG: enoyl-CoA hydratase-related protein [Cyclobacteriaceae bacterium]